MESQLVKDGAKAGTSASQVAPPTVRGIDRGHCFSYFRLSYRRKFLRTLMLAPVFWLLVFMPSGWIFPGLSGWMAALMLQALSGLQAGYNYVRWRREERQLGLPPAPLW
jgi:hypothetical protein